MKKLSYCFLGIGVILAVISVALSSLSASKYNDLINQFESGSSNIEQLQNLKDSTTTEKYNITDEMIGIIEIPSINLKYPILEGTDESILKQAVGHFPASSLPGSGSNTTLIGHNNFILAEPFKKLNLVSAGDAVNIITKDHTYKYQVVKSYIVDPYNTDIVKASSEEKLTLVTCTDNAKERLVVEALLVPTSGPIDTTNTEQQ